MALATFISENLGPLLVDWEVYASTRLPAARGLDRADLRDSAADLLRAVVADMSSAQQADKAQGRKPGNAPDITLWSHQHAAIRFGEGFTLDQMASEYRALRASVMRHWAAAHPAGGNLREVIRFNESMDQSLVEAVAWYGAHIEHARELFLGVLSHDLRNPLNTVLMGIEVLSMEKALSAPSIKVLVRMRGAGGRMTRMINDLLDFARTRLGTQLPMAPRRLQLGPVLRQTVDEFRALHPRVVLTCECPEGLAGDWDADRLAQLFSNVVGNAIQHGGPGTPIEVGARMAGTEVAITVRNQGLPIATEAIGRIFDPLMRGVASGASQRESQASLGLGLYISREIAKAHGGRIEVTSTASEGTLFTISLPLPKPRPQDRISP